MYEDLVFEKIKLLESYQQIEISREMGPYKESKDPVTEMGGNEGFKTATKKNNL